MELNDDSWHLVKETPRVMGFIGGKADSLHLLQKKKLMQFCKGFMDSVDKPRPKTVFEPGEMVRVIDGPLMILMVLLKK